MSKIARYVGNLLAFASAATGTNRTIFGDAPNQSDVLADNITADILAGWENGLDPINGFPPQENFNAVGFVATQLSAYLHQVGIAEYDSLQEYFVGSFTVKDAVLYRSLVTPNVGNTPTPGGDANWFDVLSAIGITFDDSKVPFTAASSQTAVEQARYKKNKIINGNFAVNQRVVSGTVVLAAGIYGHDRFKAGSGGCTYTFATSANITTITISAGTLVQVVEGVNFKSGLHVLSWAGTAQGQIDGGGFGSSGVTDTLIGGTNASVEFNTGTLSLVQLEEGSIFTEFEFRFLGEEEALCHLFYWADTVDVHHLAIYDIDDSGKSKTVQFPVPMRSIPTVTHTLNGDLTGSVAVTTWRDAVLFNLTIGNVNAATWVNDLTADAEL